MPPRSMFTPRCAKRTWFSGSNWIASYAPPDNRNCPQPSLLPAGRERSPPIGANLRRNSAANFPPPPWGGGLGGGVVRGGTTLPQPPDPPPRPPPSRNPRIRGF